MRIRGTLQVTISAFLLGGCVGPNPDLGAEVSNLQSQAHMPATVTIIQDTDLPKNAKLIGPVRGTSCKNKIWDPDPTNDDALEKIKTIAASQGANRIANVTYTDGGTSIYTNCWAHISASGTAYVVP